MSHVFAMTRPVAALERSDNVASMRTCLHAFAFRLKRGYEGDRLPVVASI
jgi:hypothetical protein